MTQENQPVFADTGYWIGLLIPGDDLGERVQRAGAEYQYRRIITSELVLVEFLNEASRRGEFLRGKAVQMVQELRESPRVRIIPLSGDRFWDAVTFYGSHLDQRWSLTDCVSFQIMVEWGVQEALAYDRDFAAAGFCPLLRYV